SRVTYSLSLHDALPISLVELLVTMVILGVVLSGLTTVFISGSSATVNLDLRAQGQQNARLALDRLRVDIHCASAVQAQTINTYRSEEHTPELQSLTNLV